MRILIASEGTYGDVGPFLAVARDLVRVCGHEVFALLNPAFADSAKRLGIPFRAVGRDWNEILPYVDGRLLRPGFGTIRVLRDYLLPELPQWLEATQEALDGFRPDVLRRSLARPIGEQLRTENGIRTAALAISGLGS